MTPQQWDEVNKFVETVSWDFVFGLNALLRTPYPNGSWDSDNARMLLSYSTSRNYTVQWELGNGAGRKPIAFFCDEHEFVHRARYVEDSNTSCRPCQGLPDSP